MKESVLPHISSPALQIRLVEVNQCTMLSQHFDRYSTSTGQLATRNLEDIQKLSLDTFGSKRAKRMFGQRAKNNYNAELVKDQLEATLTGEEETIYGRLESFIELINFFFVR